MIYTIYTIYIIYLIYKLYTARYNKTSVLYKMEISPGASGRNFVGGNFAGGRMNMRETTLINPLAVVS